MGEKIECPWCKDGLTPIGQYCQNCEGTALVTQGSADEACRHQYVHFETIGRCLNVWRCVTCHTLRTVDSS